MNQDEAIGRKAFDNRSSQIAKITGPSENGWNVQYPDGTEGRGIPSPYKADWQTDTWVQMIKSGKSWIILGRASQGMTNDVV